jgi:preprotein translocase subunit SecD
MDGITVDIDGRADQDPEGMRDPAPQPRRRRTLPVIRVAGMLAIAAAVVIVAAALVSALLPRVDLPVAGNPPTPVGSMTGGLRLEYQVLPSGGTVATKADVSALIDILRARIEATGVADFSISAGDTIVIDLPVDPADQASVTQLRALIGATGRVAFVALGTTPATEGERLDPVEHPPLFAGEHITAASIGQDQTGGRSIDVTLDGEATALFADYTAAHIGDYLGITLDGIVISVPVVMSAISSGSVRISVVGTPESQLADAQRLVTIINSGALPFPIEEVSPPPSG